MKRNAAVSLLYRQGLGPGQPLWQRVPTRDENGRPLNDFMMLIPKIGRWPELKREQALHELRRVISGFDERVVFADLNLNLNLLWISLRPHPDGCIAVAGAIKAVVPEAVLVASQYEAMVGAAGGGRRRAGFSWSGLRSRCRRLLR